MIGSSSTLLTPKRNCLKFINVLQLVLEKTQIKAQSMVCDLSRSHKHKHFTTNLSGLPALASSLKMLTKKPFKSVCTNC